MRWDSIRFDGVGILLHLLRFPLPAFRPCSSFRVDQKQGSRNQAGIYHEEDGRVGIKSSAKAQACNGALPTMVDGNALACIIPYLYDSILAGELSRWHVNLARRM
jgi:hypothetical protein